MNEKPVPSEAFSRVMYSEQELEDYGTEELSRVDIHSPVVLRSEYESLRQEFIEVMQYLANHSQMTENLKNYCNKTLGLLEETNDS